MATNKKTSKPSNPRPTPLRKVSKRLDLKRGDRIIFNDGQENVSLVVLSHTESQSFARRNASAAGKGGEVILFDADFEKGHVFYEPARKIQKK